MSFKGVDGASINPTRLNMCDLEGPNAANPHKIQSTDCLLPYVIGFSNAQVTSVIIMDRSQFPKLEPPKIAGRKKAK
ncbi:hypothetical protein SAMD00023353_3400380 [Rosellinia necatrix]|uniref:Uncharacterized protein n=1 Tax=Rosellinia necatrix TaxID=77044 RepID=A0A1S8A901_ROSNE|nr:hypothetical protein SAMD00023353_3400380 [Rosellinia necatrix]